MKKSMGMERSVLVREARSAVPAQDASGTGGVGVFRLSDVRGDNLLLIGPDDQPDVKEHDGAESGADHDGLE